MTFCFYFPITLDIFVHPVYIAFFSSSSSRVCIHLNLKNPSDGNHLKHVLYDLVCVSQ